MIRLAIVAAGLAVALAGIEWLRRTIPPRREETDAEWADRQW